MIATRQDFFKPEKLTSDAKAAQPESSVRSILEAETAARDKKTQRPEDTLAGADGRGTLARIGQHRASSRLRLKARGLFAADHLAG
jgi:hypothetical protein